MCLSYARKNLFVFFHVNSVIFYYIFFDIGSVVARFLFFFQYLIMLSSKYHSLREREGG